jgi:hypothetical protein
MHYDRNDKGFQILSWLRKSVQYTKSYDHKYIVMLVQ